MAGRLAGAPRQTVARVAGGSCRSHRDRRTATSWAAFEAPRCGQRLARGLHLATTTLSSFGVVCSSQRRSAGRRGPARSWRTCSGSNRVLLNEDFSATRLAQVSRSASRPGVGANLDPAAGRAPPVPGVSSLTTSAMELDVQVQQTWPFVGTAPAARRRGPRRPVPSTGIWHAWAMPRISPSCCSSWEPGSGEDDSLHSRPGPAPRRPKDERARDRRG